MRADRVLKTVLPVAFLGLTACAREPAPAPSAPSPSRQYVPIVLEPEAVTRTAQGCGVPILIEDESAAGFQRLSLAAQALDRDGRFLEESRFDAQREPVLDPLYYTATMRFGKATCQAMRSVVVTEAACTGKAGTPSSCFDRLQLRDRSGSRLRFRLR
ncbi:hypothetical protein [Azospirillum sp. sgz302134]